MYGIILTEVAGLKLDSRHGIAGRAPRDLRRYSSTVGADASHGTLLDAVKSWAVSMRLAPPVGVADRWPEWLASPSAAHWSP